MHKTGVIQLFVIFKKLYNYYIIIVFITIFLITYHVPVYIVPDFFNLYETEHIRNLIWSLITVTLSFTGLILTVLLVVYNFYLKSTRRNTFDFIIENPWLNILFSCFAGTIIFLLLCFAFINNGNKDIHLTSIYFALFSTVLLIFSQFPIVILSLKYSTSIDRFKKLISRISDNDINQFFQPELDDSSDFIENIEKNSIIILKDIGVNAIKDNDWVLPQRILQELYTIFIVPIKEDSSKEVLGKNLFCWVFICNHFKMPVIKNNDFITAKVILGFSKSLYISMATNRIRTFRGSSIDNFLKDFLRLVISNKEFKEIQEYILKDIIYIIKAHYESINYTDEELPTSSLLRNKSTISKVDINETIRFYWYYINHGLFDILIDTLEIAIEEKSKATYNDFEWKFQLLFTIICDSKNLTVFQQEDAFKNIFYRIERISKIAINNGIFNNTEIVSYYQIAEWVEKDKKLYYQSSLFYYESTLQLLNKKGNISGIHLDHYFNVGRALATCNIDRKVKQDIIERILQNAINIHNYQNTSSFVKGEITYRLQWFYNGYVRKEDDLLEVKEKFQEIIDPMISNFDYWTFLSSENKI